MSGQLSYFDPNVQHSTPQTALGTVHWDRVGRLWRYGQANGAQTAGEISQFTKTGTFDATPATTTTINSVMQMIGSPEIDMTDNYYGWFFCGFGLHEIIVTNGVSANTVMTSTATAGVIGTGGSNLDGCENIDAGVTDTRVTVLVAALFTALFAASYD